MGNADENLARLETERFNAAMVEFVRILREIFVTSETFVENVQQAFRRIYSSYQS